jgi:hypothetical protein
MPRAPRPRCLARTVPARHLPRLKKAGASASLRSRREASRAMLCAVRFRLREARVFRVEKQVRRTDQLYVWHCLESPNPELRRGLKSAPLGGDRSGLALKAELRVEPTRHRKIGSQSAKFGRCYEFTSRSVRVKNRNAFERARFTSARSAGFARWRDGRGCSGGVAFGAPVEIRCRRIGRLAIPSTTIS